MKDSETIIDEAYEFSAPHYFDFIKGETEYDVRKAELWFETALSHAPSPFMPKIKMSRSIQVENLCAFTEPEQVKKASDPSNSAALNIRNETASVPETDDKIKPPCEAIQVKTGNDTGHVSMVPDDDKCENKDEDLSIQEKEKASESSEKASLEIKDEPRSGNIEGTKACTPEPIHSQKEGSLKESQMAKKGASVVRNPSALKSKTQPQIAQARITKQASVKRDTNPKTTVATPNFAQENQAIKRQKLEGGNSRQILNLKPQNLPHKSRQVSTSGKTNLCSSTAKTQKEDRKIYVREPVAPFVSMAEMMKKFQSNTREISLTRLNSSLSHDGDASSISQRKPKLTLTRPKEPELETAQRVRSVRVKSSAELEEEMMAKIPKFKARPVNKKILEASTLPVLLRSTPQPPEFQEFNLKTMERANLNAETSSEVSTVDSSCQKNWKPKLTEPKSPHLETFLRARPTKVKSSQELEQEELEKIPKFKARPLNKKIFESKGDLGMFCNTKRHITKPKEFHFATDERIPPPIVADLFDKLSINSESRHDNPPPLPKLLTTPSPFHLHTEERGAEKEKKFYMEVIQKQLEEERARIPKATPYPYTTDYPVIPPKPEPKQCTQPEPFQLESLVRHEEEMQREMEERQRMEQEAARLRMFKAQPVMKEDPIPVPEKARKPLTQVQEFNLLVEHRAVDRAEFDKKIKEKEMMYKRYREEAESEKLMEEEKALKQLRRTLVPHARPVPNFNNPFFPQKSSKEITKPKSPNLRVVRRRERRTTIGVSMAVSSAAAHMR